MICILLLVETQVPTVRLWVLYFLAQLYDYLGDTKKALEAIDAAIHHSPTVVELYMTKAFILRKAGDDAGAMKEMDFARNLDLQDRFVNSECAKYMLFNLDTAQAVKTIALFAKVPLYINSLGGN